MPREMASDPSQLAKGSQRQWHENYAKKKFLSGEWGPTEYMRYLVEQRIGVGSGKEKRIGTEEGYRSYMEARPDQPITLEEYMANPKKYHYRIYGAKYRAGESGKKYQAETAPIARRYYTFRQRLLDRNLALGVATSPEDLLDPGEYLQVMDENPPPGMFGPDGYATRRLNKAANRSARRAPSIQAQPVAIPMELEQALEIQTPDDLFTKGTGNAAFDSLE